MYLGRKLKLALLHEKNIVVTYELWLVALYIDNLEIATHMVIRLK